MANGDMWRTPANRSMRVLDRTLFGKTIDLKAARIFENRDISKCRSLLEKSKDSLPLTRFMPVRADPDPQLAAQGRRCILLRPEFKVIKQDPPSTDVVYDESTPWPYSSTLNELIEQNLVSIIPYQLFLEYKDWTYHEIISAILPEDDQDEIPCGFSQVGHVAHLNLREKYLKYKSLIAEVLMDKNASVRTVINKIDDVGEESEFRTFKYEVLAGPDDLNVSVSEENCIFDFDYSKVYWNTRLNTEHRRLVSTFNEGDAVCDVMAGIGPFAVPAGRRRVFVHANDLNPDSHASMVTAITKNNVGDFVFPHCEDGRTFIRDAVARLITKERPHQVKLKPKVSRRDAKKATTNTPNEPPPSQQEKILIQPPLFAHFIMNLPASAITFLPSFIGLYSQPHIQTFLKNLQSSGKFFLPTIHVYCFSTKSEDNIAEGHKICEEISRQLDFEMHPGKIEEGGVEVFDVRDVAPKKRMFCASFRLPEEVAFRKMERGGVEAERSC
jgi:tRNA (guanine37-N1)-methyltransferase